MPGRTEEGEGDEEWSDPSDDAVKSGSATDASRGETEDLWTRQNGNPSLVTFPHSTLTSRRKDPVCCILDKIDAELAAMSGPQTQASTILGRTTPTFKLGTTPHPLLPKPSTTLQDSHVATKSTHGRTIGAPTESEEQRISGSAEIYTDAALTDDDFANLQPATEDFLSDLDSVVAQQIDSRFKEIMLRKRVSPSPVPAIPPKPILPPPSSHQATHTAPPPPPPPPPTALKPLSTVGYGTDNDSIKTEDFEHRFNTLLVLTDGNASGDVSRKPRAKHARSGNKHGVAGARKGGVGGGPATRSGNGTSSGKVSFDDTWKDKDNEKSGRSLNTSPMSSLNRVLQHSMKSLGETTVKEPVETSSGVSSLPPSGRSRSVSPERLFLIHQAGRRDYAHAGLPDYTLGGRPYQSHWSHHDNAGSHGNGRPPQQPHLSSSSGRSTFEEVESLCLSRSSSDSFGHFRSAPPPSGRHGGGPGGSQSLQLLDGRLLSRQSSTTSTSTSSGNLAEHLERRSGSTSTSGSVYDDNMETLDPRQQFDLSDHHLLDGIFMRVLEWNNAHAAMGRGGGGVGGVGGGVPGSVPFPQVPPGHFLPGSYPPPVGFPHGVSPQVPSAFLPSPHQPPTGADSNPYAKNLPTAGRRLPDTTQDKTLSPTSDTTHVKKRRHLIIPDDEDELSFQRPSPASKTRKPEVSPRAGHHSKAASSFAAKQVSSDSMLSSMSSMSQSQDLAWKEQFNQGWRDVQRAAYRDQAMQGWADPYVQPHRRSDPNQQLWKDQQLPPAPSHSSGMMLPPGYPRRMSRGMSMDSFGVPSPPESYMAPYGAAPQAQNPAEAMLMNLGFGGSAEGFLPERFMRDWYNKLSRTQTQYPVNPSRPPESNSASLYGSASNLHNVHDPKVPFLSKPSYEDLRSASDLQRRYAHPLNRSATVSTSQAQSHEAPETPTAMLPPGFGKESRSDRLKEYIEAYAQNMNSTTDARSLRIRQFASCRQKSLPSYLETLTEEDEAKTRSTGYKPQDRESHLRAFLREDSMSSKSDSRATSSGGASNDQSLCGSESDSLSGSDNLSYNRRLRHDRFLTARDSPLPVTSPSSEVISRTLTLKMPNPADRHNKQREKTGSPGTPKKEQRSRKSSPKSSPLRSVHLHPDDSYDKQNDYSPPGDRSDRPRSPTHRSKSSSSRSNSPTPRSKSPSSRSKSPSSRSQSPSSRSKSPTKEHRARSPNQRNKSPRHRSKSPRHHRSKSPHKEATTGHEEENTAEKSNPPVNCVDDSSSSSGYEAKKANALNPSKLCVTRIGVESPMRRRPKAAEALSTSQQPHVHRDQSSGGAGGHSQNLLTVVLNSNNPQKPPCGDDESNTQDRKPDKAEPLVSTESLEVADIFHNGNSKKTGKDSQNSAGQAHKTIAGQGGRGQNSAGQAHKTIAGQGGRGQNSAGQANKTMAGQGGRGQLEPAMISIVLEDVDGNLTEKAGSDWDVAAKHTLQLPAHLTDDSGHHDDLLHIPSRSNSISLSPIPQSPVTVIEVSLDNQHDSMDTEEGTCSSKDHNDEGETSGMDSDTVPDYLGDDTDPNEFPTFLDKLSYGRKLSSAMPFSHSSSDEDKVSTCSKKEEADACVEANDGKVSPLLLFSSLSPHTSSSSSPSAVVVHSTRASSAVQADDGRLSPLVALNYEDSVSLLVQNDDAEELYLVSDQGVQCDGSSEMSAVQQNTRAEDELPLVERTHRFTQTSRLVRYEMASQTELFSQAQHILSTASSGRARNSPSPRTSPSVLHSFDLQQTAQKRGVNYDFATNPCHSSVRKAPSNGHTREITNEVKRTSPSFDSEFWEFLGMEIPARLRGSQKCVEFEERKDKISAPVRDEYSKKFADNQQGSPFRVTHNLLSPGSLSPGAHSDISRMSRHSCGSIGPYLRSLSSPSRSPFSPIKPLHSPLKSPSFPVKLQSPFMKPQASPIRLQSSPMKQPSSVMNSQSSFVRFSSLTESQSLLFTSPSSSVKSPPSPVKAQSGLKTQLLFTESTSPLKASSWAVRSPLSPTKSSPGRLVGISSEHPSVDLKPRAANTDDFQLIPPALHTPSLRLTRPATLGIARTPADPAHEASYLEGLGIPQQKSSPRTPVDPAHEASYPEGLGIPQQKSFPRTPTPTDNKAVNTSVTMAVTEEDFRDASSPAIEKSHCYYVKPFPLHAANQGSVCGSKSNSPSQVHVSLLNFLVDDYRGSEQEVQTNTGSGSNSQNHNTSVAEEKRLQNQAEPKTSVSVSPNHEVSSVTRPVQNWRSPGKAERPAEAGKTFARECTDSALEDVQEALLSAATNTAKDSFCVAADEQDHDSKTNKVSADSQAPLRETVHAETHAENAGAEENSTDRTESFDNTSVSSLEVAREVALNRFLLKSPQAAFPETVRAETHAENSGAEESSTDTTDGFGNTSFRSIEEAREVALNHFLLRSPQAPFHETVHPEAQAEHAGETKAENAGAEKSSTDATDGCGNNTFRSMEEAREFALNHFLLKSPQAPLPETVRAESQAENAGAEESSTDTTESVDNTSFSSMEEVREVALNHFLLRGPQEPLCETLQTETQAENAGAEKSSTDTTDGFGNTSFSSMEQAREVALNHFLLRRPVDTKKSESAAAKADVDTSGLDANQANVKVGEENVKPLTKSTKTMSDSEAAKNKVFELFKLRGGPEPLVNSSTAAAKQTKEYGPVNDNSNIKSVIPVMRESLVEKDRQATETYISVGADTNQDCESVSWHIQEHASILTNSLSSTITDRDSLDNKPDAENRLQNIESTCSSKTKIDKDENGTKNEPNEGIPEVLIQNRESTHSPDQGDADQTWLIETYAHSIIESACHDLQRTYFENKQRLQGRLRNELKLSGVFTQTKQTETGLAEAENHTDAFSATDSISSGAESSRSTSDSNNLREEYAKHHGRPGDDDCIQHSPDAVTSAVSDSDEAPTNTSQERQDSTSDAGSELSVIFADCQHGTFESMAVDEKKAATEGSSFCSFENPITRVDPPTPVLPDEDVPVLSRDRFFRSLSPSILDPAFVENSLYPGRSLSVDSLNSLRVNFSESVEDILDTFEPEIDTNFSENVLSDSDSELLDPGLVPYKVEDSKLLDPGLVPYRVEDSTSHNDNPEGNTAVHTHDAHSSRSQSVDSLNSLRVNCTGSLDDILEGELDDQLTGEVQANLEEDVTDSDVFSTASSFVEKAIEMSEKNVDQSDLSLVDQFDSSYVADTNGNTEEKVGDSVNTLSNDRNTSRESGDAPSNDTDTARDSFNALSKDRNTSREGEDVLSDDTDTSSNLSEPLTEERLTQLLLMSVNHPQLQLLRQRGISLDSFDSSPNLTTPDNDSDFEGQETKTLWTQSPKLFTSQEGELDSEDGLASNVALSLNEDLLFDSFNLRRVGGYLSNISEEEGSFDKSSEHATELFKPDSETLTTGERNVHNTREELVKAGSSSRLAGLDATESNETDSTLSRIEVSPEETGPCIGVSVEPLPSDFEPGEISISFEDEENESLAKTKPENHLTSGLKFSFEVSCDEDDTELEEVMDGNSIGKTQNTSFLLVNNRQLKSPVLFTANESRERRIDTQMMNTSPARGQEKALITMETPVTKLSIPIEPVKNNDAKDAVSAEGIPDRPQRTESGISEALPASAAEDVEALSSETFAASRDDVRSQLHLSLHPLQGKPTSVIKPKLLSAAERREAFNKITLERTEFGLSSSFSEDNLSSPPLKPKRFEWPMSKESEKEFRLSPKRCKRAIARRSHSPETGSTRGSQSLQVPMLGESLVSKTTLSQSPPLSPGSRRPRCQSPVAEARARSGSCSPVFPDGASQVPSAGSPVLLVSPQPNLDSIEASTSTRDQSPIPGVTLSPVDQPHELCSPEEASTPLQFTISRTFYSSKLATQTRESRSRLWSAGEKRSSSGESPIPTSPCLSRDPSWTSDSSVSVMDFVLSGKDNQASMADSAKLNVVEEMPESVSFEVPEPEADCPDADSDLAEANSDDETSTKIEDADDYRLSPAHRGMEGNDASTQRGHIGDRVTLAKGIVGKSLVSRHNKEASESRILSPDEGESEMSSKIRGDGEGTVPSKHRDEYDDRFSAKQQEDGDRVSSKHRDNSGREICPKHQDNAVRTNPSALRHHGNHGFSSRHHENPSGSGSSPTTSDSSSANSVVPSPIHSTTALHARRSRFQKPSNTFSFHQNSSSSDQSSSETGASPRRRFYWSSGQRTVVSLESDVTKQSSPGSSQRGTTHGSPRGTTHGSPRGTTHDSPRETTHGSPRGTTHGSPRGTTHGSPRGTTHGSPRGTTHGSPSCMDTERFGKSSLANAGSPLKYGESPAEESRRKPCVSSRPRSVAQAGDSGGSSLSDGISSDASPATSPRRLVGNNKERGVTSMGLRVTGSLLGHETKPTPNSLSPKASPMNGLRKDSASPSKSVRDLARQFEERATK